MRKSNHSSRSFRKSLGATDTNSNLGATLSASVTDLAKMIASIGSRRVQIFPWARGSRITLRTAPTVLSFEIGRLCCNPFHASGSPLSDSSFPRCQVEFASVQRHEDLNG